MTLLLHVRPGTGIIAHKGLIKQSVGWQTSIGVTTLPTRVGQGTEEDRVLYLSQPSHIGPMGPSYTTEELLCVLFTQKAGSGGRVRVIVLWQSKRIAKDSQDSPQKLSSHPPNTNTIHQTEWPTQQAKQHTRFSNTH